ncbi:MAG: S1C family serine protease, partial [Acidimicrobiia bacterium]
MSGGPPRFMPDDRHDRDYHTMKINDSTRRNTRTAIAAVAAAVALVAALAAGPGLVGAGVTEASPSGAPQATGSRAASNQNPGAGAPAFDVALTDVSELVKATEGKIVTVTQTRLRLDELGQGLTEVPAGTGTGIVIDAQGHILTNAHVVAGALNVIVVGPDGRRRPGQVLGTWAADQNSDLALLRIDDAEGLQPIILGSSADLEVGEPVVAIGNALGLGLSVSVGIVSAKERTIRTEVSSLEALLQTDAAINPGNSGGPLLNKRGELVGINTAVAGGAENIGFAIPVDEAIPFIAYVVGEAGQPFLGVGLATVTPQLAGRFELPVDRGAVITEVFGGAPGAEAGLRPGDIVITANAQPIRSREALIDE